MAITLLIWTPQNLVPKPLKRGRLQLSNGFGTRFWGSISTKLWACKVGAKNHTVLESPKRFEIAKDDKFNFSCNTGRFLTNLVLIDSPERALSIGANFVQNNPVSTEFLGHELNNHKLNALSISEKGSIDSCSFF